MRWATTHSSHTDNATHGRATEMTTSSSSSATVRRKNLLHERLQEIGIDATRLEAAAIQSIQDPMQGFDARYGKSSIKTYVAFIDPKTKRNRKPSSIDEEARNSVEEEQSSTTTNTKLAAEANRVAHHIDFLIKRHKAHEAEWIRHHDFVSDSDAVNETDNSNERRQVFPIIVVLDNLRSAANVGNIFRTADATGCRLVITTGITPHPNGNGAQKVQKASLGAERYVPHRHFLTTRDAIDLVRTEFPDYTVIGMETTQHSIPHTEHQFSKQGVVLLLGNEVTGVDTTIMQELCDAIVEIPMFGAKNSLNVAACGGCRL